MLKQFVVAAVAVFVSATLGLAEAEAKRLGGAKSFGMQRDALPAKPMNAPQAGAPAAAAAPNAAPPAAAGAGAAAAGTAGKSSWLGPLAGLAIGAGLATLFAGTPFGGFLGALALGVLIFFGVMLVMRLLRRAPEAQGAPTPGALRYATAGAPAPAGAPPHSGTAGGASSAGQVAGFDTESFLRHAKLNFIRLQAAFDAGNLEDIRNFTSPEVYAEVRMQVDERGGARQQTDVITLEAELLDLVEDDGRYVASVRYSGALREDEGGTPAPFAEVWHLTKPIAGAGGWVIAGIQQETALA